MKAKDSASNIYSTGVAVQTTNPTDPAGTGTEAYKPIKLDCENPSELSQLQLDTNEIIKEMMMRRSPEGLNLLE